MLKYIEKTAHNEIKEKLKEIWKKECTQEEKKSQDIWLKRKRWFEKEEYTVKKQINEGENPSNTMPIKRGNNTLRYNNKRNGENSWYNNKQYKNYSYRANNTFRCNNDTLRYNNKRNGENSWYNNQQYKNYNYKAKLNKNKTRQRSYKPSNAELVKKGLTERNTRTQPLKRGNQLNRQYDTRRIRRNTQMLRQRYRTNRINRSALLRSRFFSKDRS